MMSVAERFESVRTMLHMNRSQFADFLGITGSLVSSMERGSAMVSRKTTARLADLLSINPIWLQYGVGDMFARPDITLESILDSNPALKSIYDARIEKDLSVQRRFAERQEKAERRLIRKREAARRLKAFRDYVGINQNQLAKRLGVSRELISSIEKEKKLISEHMAEQIEEQFGISAAWLLGGDGEMIVSGEPVQLRLDDLITEQKGYQMLARMVCALTEKVKSGDWETLNTLYSELIDPNPTEQICEDPRCERIAG